MSKMKWLSSLALVLCIANASPIEIEKRALDKRPMPYGIDVSSHQGDVNWSQVTGQGQWHFIRACEITSLEKHFGSHVCKSCCVDTPKNCYLTERRCQSMAGFLLFKPGCMAFFFKKTIVHEVYIRA